MKSPIIILGVLLPVLFAACENQNSDGVTARIRFAAVQGAAGSKLSTRASEAEGILIDSATISLQNIRLLVQNSNNQIVPGNTVFPGPYLIDLVTRKSVPVIESSAISPGTYYGLNALLFIPKSTVPSVYVSGTYTLNDKWWKFYYTNSGSLTFQVTDSAGFTIDQLNPEIWVLIDVVSFFKGVDFSKAVADNDNVIRINESSNAALAVAVQGNFTVAASVSNNPPQSKDENSTGGSSSGQGSNSSSGNSSSANNSNGNGSGSSGSISNSGSNNQNKDKEKAKDKQKEKEKNGNKSKHDQKDNNKSKDKNKDKDKDKNDH